MECVQNKETAEEYLIVKTIELGSTLKVTKKDFDQEKYEKEKRSYEICKKSLVRDYGIDTRACDIIIGELESLVEIRGFFKKN